MSLAASPVVVTILVFSVLLAAGRADAQEAGLAEQVKKRPQRSVGVAAKLDYSSTTGGGGPDFSSIAAGGNINVTLLDEAQRHGIGLAFSLNSSASGTVHWETGSTSYTPNVFYRINTDPFGAAGSLVLFFGAQVGVNITQNFRRLPATDATPAMTEQITTAAFSTGP